MNDRLLTVEQVSEYLGVHRDTVYAMIRSRRLPALQLGGRKASWRISETDLTEFVSSRKGGGGHTSQNSDEIKALERAAFDREQQQRLDAFQAEQADRLARFNEGQDRARRRGTPNRNGNSAHQDGAVGTENR